MATQDPEIKRRNRFFDITIGVFAVAAIVLSALIILSLPGGTTATGMASVESALLSGEKGSDDAMFFSYLIAQHGRVDERVLESYEEFSRFQDLLNFIFASPDMGAMRMAPLEITEAEFSSKAFFDRYYLITSAYNRVAQSASEVQAGNRAAEERFLVDLYSFELYLDGVSSRSYWRLHELPVADGLSEIREKLGSAIYQQAILNAYNLLAEQDSNMPSYNEWVSG